MGDQGNWCMNVDGRVYGPYSTKQMQGFVSERRLAYHSLVAPAGSRDFRPALQHSELKVLFSQTAESPAGGGADTEAAGQALLVVFGSDRAAEMGAAILSNLDRVIPLSGSASLVLSDVSAEALRDRLSARVPNTERVLVFPCGRDAAACYGVSLEEHERIAKLLAGARNDSF